MINKRISLGVMITAIIISIATPTEAGLWDTIKEQADKARGAIESLDRTAESAGNNAPTANEEDQRATAIHTEPVRTVPSISTRTLPAALHYDHAQVRAIQTQLNTLGYSVGSADGYYGPGTRKGIEAFQRTHSLPVDGKPSAALQASLETEIQTEHHGSPEQIVTSAVNPTSPIVARENGSASTGEMPSGETQPFAAATDQHLNTEVTSPLIKPLNLKFIKGRPVIDSNINGIAGSDGKRLLELLVIGAKPDLLTPPEDWLNEVSPNNYCSTGQQNYACLLASLVNEHFTKEVRDKYLSGTGRTVLWRSRDEFKLRNDLQYIADKLVPELKTTASNFRFPLEIAIEQNEILSPYDFQKQLYPASYNVLWGDAPSYNFPVIMDYQKLHLPSFEVPHEIKLNPEKAQELHQRAGRGYLKVVYVIELQGLETNGIRGQVKSIDLYSQGDKRFTSPLYSYDPASFNKTEAVVENNWALGWEKSLNWQKSPAGIPDVRYFLTAYSKLYGDGENTINAILESYTSKTFTVGTPFDIERNKAAFMKQFDRDERNGLETMLASFNPDESVYLPGQVTLGEYNLKTKSFPVNNIDVATVTQQFYRQNQDELIKRYPFYQNALPYLDGTPKALEIDPALAQTLYKKALYPSQKSPVLPVLIKSVPVKIKKDRKDIEFDISYLQAGVRFAVQEIEILDFGPELASARGNDRYGLFSDKLNNFDHNWVLWRYSAAEQQARAAETNAAAENERLAREKAEAVAAKSEKEKYAGKFNVLGVAIGMDLKDAEAALDPYFRDKQVVRYTTSPAQVVGLMQKFGIKPPTPATSQSDLINQSSEATNADSQAYNCKLTEDMRKRMQNQVGGLGNTQANWHATVKWQDRDLNCQEMEIVAKLLILNQGMAKDALHTATGFGVGEGEFIAFYTNTNNQVVAMLRQIRFPKDTSPSRQALMKDLDAKYGEPTTEPRSSGSGQAIWLLPTTKSTRPVGCGAAVKQSSEVWFKDDTNGSAMSGVGLSMTLTDFKSATQIASGSCSETVIADFDDSKEGLRLNQIVLADHQDLDAALPPLFKSAGMAISSFTKVEEEPAAKVQF